MPHSFHCRIFFQSCKCFVTGSLLLLSLTLISQETFTDLHILVKGIKNSRGSLILDLYQDEKSYQDEIPLRTISISKKERNLSNFRISIHLPEAFYAIVLVDDVNENGKIDRNLFGYPQEGFAFSGLDKFPLKKPAFDAIKFRLTCIENRIELKMLY